MSHNIGIKSEPVPDEYLPLQDATESLLTPSQERISERVSLETLHAPGIELTLVFVHGWLGSLWNQFPQLDPFVRSRELATYTLAGNGNSTTWPE